MCRLLLDGMIRSGSEHRGDTPVPWPTIMINVSGSLVLGVVVGLTISSVLPAGWEPVVGSGFLGGFTTFSTASVEAVRLGQAQRWTAAAATAIGVLLAGAAAAGLGMWAGSLVT